MLKQKLTLRSFIPKSFKKILRKLYSRQFQLGFSPEDLNSLSPIVKYSLNDKEWKVEYEGGWGGWIPAANHSHGYHGLLKQWWTEYGLGKKCLLISETCEVANQFYKLYPLTKMISTDFYLDLIEDGKTDVLWNLYEPIPEKLEKLSFGSILCQATFEHLMDPIGVTKKFSELLENGGFLYLHTHTPMYPYHNWPSDYLRYFPDWFRDIEQIIPNLKLVELYCKEGHAFAAYKKVSN